MARKVIRRDLALAFKEMTGEDFGDVEVYKTAGYPRNYHSPSLLKLSRSRSVASDLPTLSLSLLSAWKSDNFSITVSTNGFINFSASGCVLSESSSEEDSFEAVPCKVIGVVSSSTFIDKWGTPRQGQLAPDSISTITLTQRLPDLLTPGSRVLIFWVPHLNRNNPTKALVRPPKAVGIKVGVFATRSPHRPSPVCMSVCLVVSDSGVSLEVGGRT